MTRGWPAASLNQLRGGHILSLSLSFSFCSYFYLCNKTSFTPRLRLLSEKVNDAISAAEEKPRRAAEINSPCRDYRADERHRKMDDCTPSAIEKHSPREIMRYKFIL